MNLPPSLRFTLGIFRHPSQALRRLRELSRIIVAPSVDKAIPLDKRIEVDVINVTDTGSLGEKLVAIYANNPSPFVYGPTNLEMLARDLEKGIRYYLIENSDGELVGVRAFETRTKLLVSSVTDFPFRGKGYQIRSADIVRKRLAQEGFRKFRCAVMKENTRQIRVLTAQGWEIESHPKKAHLVRGVLRVGEDGKALQRSN